MLACHISILIDCQGPSNTITEADASSNLAIAEAARIIARGRADVMITGGADSKIHPLSLVRMACSRTCRAGRASRARRAGPFDRRRDGWVPGEGPGIVILEEWSHALKRGARIQGEVLGGGSGCDAMPGGGLDPDGGGTEVAITAALEEAGLAPAGDRPCQRPRIGRPGSPTWPRPAPSGGSSGPAGVPVTALKGYMGNLASGCGAVEMIVSLIGVNRGKIPPILNCDQPDPEMELDLVLEVATSDRESDLREHEPDTQRPGGGPRDPGLPE